MKYPTHTADGITLRDNDLPPYTGCPHSIAPCEWQPLERLADLAERAGCPFHPWSFMFMGTLEGPEPIHAYKHSDTRRYLHVGESGHTYRYGWTRNPTRGPDGAATFTPYGSPADAIADAYR